MPGEVSPADPRYAEGIHHRCETLGRPDRDRDLTGLSVCFSARAFAHRADSFSANLTFRPRA
jgi:hypothetical protein